MIKFFIPFLIAASFGCQSETKYGKCVGVDDPKEPNLIYKISVRNAILSIVFIETLITPIVVVVNELECPVAFK